MGYTGHSSTSHSARLSTVEPLYTLRMHTNEHCKVEISRVQLWLATVKRPALSEVLECPVELVFGGRRGSKIRIQLLRSKRGRISTESNQLRHSIHRPVPVRTLVQIPLNSASPTPCFEPFFRPCSSYYSDLPGHVLLHISAVRTRIEPGFSRGGPMTQRASRWCRPICMPHMHMGKTNQSSRLHSLLLSSPI